MASASKKIRRGDKVVVTAGNSRGQTGTVVKIDDERVVVQGVNLRKKCVKPTQQNPKGSIIDIELPIHISNVSVCDDEGTPLKLKVKQEKSGDKVLYYKKAGKETVYRSMKKQDKS